jgi:hypothetical protein
VRARVVRETARQLYRLPAAPAGAHEAGTGRV